MATREQYIEFFHEADADKKGTLSKQELMELLRSKGYKGTDSDLLPLFESLDMSGDGELTEKEFLTILDGIPPETQKKMALRALFRDYDKDGNGYIERGEIKAYCTKAKSYLSEAEVDRMMKRLDTTGDDKINYEEFLDSFNPSECD